MERLHFVKPDEPGFVAQPPAQAYNQVVAIAQAVRNLKIEGYRAGEWSDANVEFQKIRNADAEEPEGGTAEVGTFRVTGVFAEHLTAKRYSIDPATNTVTLGTEVFQIAKQPHMRASTWSTMTAGWGSISSKTVDGRTYEMWANAANNPSGSWRINPYDHRKVTITDIPANEEDGESANPIGAETIEQVVPGWIPNATIIHAIKAPSAIISLAADVGNGHPAVSCEWLDLSSQTWLPIQKEIVVCVEVAPELVEASTQRARVLIRCSEAYEDA
jgi:hypothetical protein